MSSPNVSATDIAAAAALLSDPRHAVTLPVAVRQALLASVSTPKRLQIDGSTAQCYVHSVTEDGRIRKFKEPWTIEWLRALPGGAVLYDVGANIGVTTLVAAERPGVRIVAIEPAPVNFASLVKNIALNGLSDRVCPLALGLGAHTGVMRLNLASDEAGAAMHSFGAILQLAGDPERIPTGAHQCMCMRLDDLVAWNGLPFPTHVKIDVDGAELDVLRGAGAVLADERCRAMQIEVVDQDASCERSTDVTALMTAAGWRETMRHGRRAEFPRVSDLQFVRA